MRVSFFCCCCFAVARMRERDEMRSTSYLVAWVVLARAGKDVDRVHKLKFNVSF
jgi:hypothetical protein